MLWILLFILLIVLIIVGATAVMIGQDQGGDASGYPSREIYRRQHVNHEHRRTGAGLRSRRP